MAFDAVGREHSDHGEGECVDAHPDEVAELLAALRD
jgi:hypothetical protein